ncbi:glutathione S-transferase family protein [Falsirhodobacter xinxiangensis]|uniref:glutathione S-transferase family protein n=1 Tax=Falsirhodobacter xinxiangensis TaxID=2530049 RepID=UPI0010AA2F1C|nr:glutathione S-transferase [Rhodobacter xinxiangensis]
MPLILTHLSRSRSTRILWLLEEIGCEYELVLAGEGETFSLRDGQTTIHETGAMNEWLCETWGQSLWRAPTHPSRLAWLDWLHFGETLLAGPTDGVSSKLNLLSDWLEASEWLLDEFSGVDCQVGYSLWALSQKTDLKDRPPLTSYLKRCQSRPAFGFATGR